MRVALGLSVFRGLPHLNDAWLVHGNASFRLRLQVARKVDRKHTTASSDVPDPQASTVGLDAGTGDGQTQASSRPVRSPLGEWLEQQLRIAVRQPAAAVLHLNENTICRCVGTQGDFAVRMAELERVLQQVAYGGRQQIAVAGYRKLGIDRRHDQHTTSDVGFQRRRELRLGDEVSERENPGAKGDGEN